MRHRKAGRKLSRNTSHREAMLRNMVTSLLKHEKIRTTDAKAKELRGVAEEMITLAKRGDVHARRQAAAVIRDRQTTKKLFEEFRERFIDRPGGYTRITKIGPRPGDAAPVSLIELLPSGEKKAPAPKAKGRKRSTAPAKKKAVKAGGAVKEKAKTESST